MRLLVTGASGLLGLNLALEASQHHTVFGVVRENPIKLDAFEVLQTDLLAPKAVEDMLEHIQPDAIIHCAALAHVDACEDDPTEARRINAELPGFLAAKTAEEAIPFVQVSTDGVFDGQRGDYTEADEPNPLSIYARTKLEGEGYVSEFHPGAIIARANMFGWSPSGQRSLAEFFYNNLSANNPVKGFTDVYFCPLLVNDLAQILLAMLDKKLTGLYHTVSSDCISKYDFGVAIARRFGLDESLITAISVDDAGLSAARSPKLTLSSEKLARDLGQPIPTIEEGMERFHSLHKENYPQKLQEMRGVPSKS
ncbi:MAG: SDR family oxidoreductase [Chloroflexi bacterium]|nr:SDR family oxidoreductase [Chloroflexota bacterium]